MREPTPTTTRGDGERSTRVVSRTIPGRVSDNAPSSPSPFRPRKHHRVKKPTRSRRPLSHDSSYDRYRFPFQSLFCLLLDLSLLPLATPSASLLHLVQDSRWSCSSHETHVCVRISLNEDEEKGPRNEEGRRITRLIRRFTCAQTMKGWC